MQRISATLDRLNIFVAVGVSVSRRASQRVQQQQSSRILVFPILGCSRAGDISSGGQRNIKHEAVG